MTKLFNSVGKTKNPEDKFPTPTPDHQTLEPPPVPPVSFGCKCGALDEESMEGVKHGKTFGRGRKNHWKRLLLYQILCNFYLFIDISILLHFKAVPNLIY